MKKIFKRLEKNQMFEFFFKGLFKGFFKKDSNVWKQKSKKEIYSKACTYQASSSSDEDSSSSSSSDDNDDTTQNRRNQSTSRRNTTSFAQCAADQSLSGISFDDAMEISVSGRNELSFETAADEY